MLLPESTAAVKCVGSVRGSGLSGNRSKLAVMS